MQFTDLPPIEYGHCRVVAEAGQCHEGQVDEAVVLAEAASRAGCWGVKYQFLNPDTIAAPAADKYWADSLDTTDQRDTFETAGVIPYDAWQPVVDACTRLGIAFLATPFDLEAVEALERYDVPAYKIASGDITNKALIEACASTGKPMFLSTGAADMHEVCMALVWASAVPVIPFACSLVYPSEPSDANLARIERLRELTLSGYVGYSDHTTLTETGMAAAALGATVVEKHFTRKRNGQVADQAMALDPVEMDDYVDLTDEGVALRGSSELAPTEREEVARAGARRSLHAARPIAAGQVLVADDISVLRPGGGLPPSVFDDVVGQRAAVAHDVGQLLHVAGSTASV